jgi:hypothetical protein
MFLPKEDGQLNAANEQEKKPVIPYNLKLPFVANVFKVAQPNRLKQDQSKANYVGHRVEQNSQIKQLIGAVENVQVGG